MLVVLLAGCYPVTRVQIPRTTPAGKLHGALGLAVSPNDNMRPSPDFALRYGLTDRIDLGLRLRASAIEIGPKIQLVRDTVEVSIAPAFLAADDRDSLYDETPMPDDNTSVMASRVSVYVGSNMDQKFSGFIAPTLDVGQRTYEDEVSTHRTRLLAAGVLGGMLVAPSSSLHVLFELGVLFPAGGDSIVTVDGAPYPYQTLLGPGDRRVELSVALLFGSFED
jgi:hypothetical protein